MGTRLTKKGSAAVNLRGAHVSREKHHRATRPIPPFCVVAPPRVLYLRLGVDMKKRRKFVSVPDNFGARELPFPQRHLTAHRQTKWRARGPACPSELSSALSPHLVKKGILSAPLLAEPHRRAYRHRREFAVAKSSNGSPDRGSRMILAAQHPRSGPIAG